MDAGSVSRARILCAFENLARASGLEKSATGWLLLRHAVHRAKSPD